MQKIDCKNEIYTKNWVRSTWTAKVNSGKKSTVKVNHKSKSTSWSTMTWQWCQQMTWQWWCHLGLMSARGTLRVTARGCAWRCVVAREGSWRHVERVSSCAEYSGDAWGRVAAPMMVRFPREGRSVEEDLSGTCKNTIGARIMAATLWQWSRDYEWRRLQVRNQRRWLKRVRGLMVNGCSNSCKGGSNCESKIILIKTGLPRKSQSDGSDTMLEILEDLYCIS